MKQIKLN